jgi:hypothetical protein
MNFLYECHKWNAFSYAFRLAHIQIAQWDILHFRLYWSYYYFWRVGAGSCFKYPNSQGDTEDADFLATTLPESAHILLWRFVVFSEVTIS